MFLFFLLPILNFYKGIHTFFAQDDFLFLLITKKIPILSIWKFFIPLENTVWYRPLSTQIFFYFGQLLFGSHVYLYHLFVLCTHFITTYCIYKLANKLLLSKTTALVVCVMYGFHQIHTISLAWLSSYSFILGPCFLVLCLSALFDKNSKKAFIYFIFGLLTTEVSIVILPLYISFQIFYSKKLNWVKIGYWIIPVILLLFLRFGLFPTHNLSDQYHIGINLESLRVLKFYALRMLGVPYFYEGMNIVLRYLSVLLAGILSLFPIVVLVLYRNVVQWRRVGFALCIAFFGLLPFILLSEHQAPYYGSFSLIGVCLLYGEFVNAALRGNIKQRRGVISILSCFVLLNVVGSLWMYDSHWIFKRSVIAEKLIHERKFNYPIGSEEYFSLGAGAAQEYYR